MSSEGTAAFLHWCESCGHEEPLSAQDAFDAGWDFPPKMGAWGVVSPRTCPHCTIEKTAWWAITMDKHGMDDLTPHHLKTIGRILEELPPGAEGRPRRPWQQ